ncbi:uncharacterized protein LOC124552616 [Schistocerca americana]|nr:uncharacterized protein LOC124552616 [Schistocerca americana]XP_046982898.1 uncharacterized protein LOC124552616 [Schistocerca americana]XP_046982899.1 uncharacterized protein LOC124552616 [Schistocerca americana]
MASSPTYHENSSANSGVASGGSPALEADRHNPTADGNSSMCYCTESNETGGIKGDSEAAGTKTAEESENGCTSETGSSVATYRASILDLPDEIMIKIMSYLTFSELLDVVQKVCSRWKCLSQDAELWYDKVYVVRSWCCSHSATRRGDKTDREAVQTLYNAPNLRTVLIQRGAKSSVFRALYTNCRQLTNLQIGATQKLSYSVMKSLVEKCSKIHTLRISNHLLQSPKFVEALSQLQHLHWLQLEEYSATDRRVLLRPLADGCPQLSEIDLGHMYYDFEDLAYFLRAKSRNLKYLGVRWSMESRRCIVPLLTVCADTLERLELYQYDVPRNEAREAFVALGKLQNLQELTSMSLDSSLTGIVPLAFRDGGLSKLKLLDLWDGYGLEDDAVVAISLGCPVLRELRLRHAIRISDAAFSQIHHLKCLQLLDLSACEGLGGALMPYLARLPVLRALLMEEMNLSQLQPGLACILDLTNLRCLNLNSCNVRAVPFAKFPDRLINLRKLHLENSEGDRSVVEELHERMADLQIFGMVRDEPPSVFSESDLSDDSSDYDDDDDDDDDVGGGNGAGPGGGNAAGNYNSENYCAGGACSDIEDVDVSLLFLENGELE